MNVSRCKLLLVKTWGSAMMCKVRDNRTDARNILSVSACTLGVAALVGAVMLVVTPHEVSAKAEFSQQTSLPCGQCHSNPAGGGKLKAFGERFKANGNKVK